MNCTHLRYCQRDGLWKGHLPGLIPIDGIQKIMNDLMIPVLR